MTPPLQRPYLHSFQLGKYCASASIHSRKPRPLYYLQVLCIPAWSSLSTCRAGPFCHYSLLSYSRWPAAQQTPSGDSGTRLSSNAGAEYKGTLAGAQGIRILVQIAVQTAVYLALQVSVQVAVPKPVQVSVH